jgi:hypothetical protein
MIVPQSFTEQMLFSTFRLEVDKGEGCKGVGTAFAYEVQTPAGGLKLLMTNRHVIENARAWSFRYHVARTLQEPSGQVETALGLNTDEWITHPDPAVDLCGAFLDVIRAREQRAGKMMFHRSLGDDYVPSAEVLGTMTAVEDILMIGYPTGLYDEHNNLPIMRSGMTASHPAVDFNGVAEGMVDVACFPGSSGSPIVHFAKFYLNKALGGTLTAGPRIWFLGVQVAAPVWTSEGCIEVVPTPTGAETGALAFVPQTMHLGY